MRRITVFVAEDSIERNVVLVTVAREADAVAENLEEVDKVIFEEGDVVYVVLSVL